LDQRFTNVSKIAQTLPIIALPAKLLGLTSDRYPSAAYSISWISA